MIALLAVIGLVGHFLYRFYKQRTRFRNLPGPPHHPIFGHLPIMAEAAKSLPPDANPQVYAHMIRNKYGLGDFFYLDLWPVTASQLVVVEPELAAQITQQQTFDKGDMVRKFLGPLVGEKAMVASNGHQWKLARRLFNPSMIHGNLLQHVPEIVKDTLLFCDILERNSADQKVFESEDITARLIFNIAARIMLGIDCNVLRSEHEFMTLFRNQALLLPTAFWARYLADPSPWRNYMRWKNTKALNQFIGNIVDERFQSGVLANSPEKRGASRKKPVAVDYALEAYLDSAATQPAELEDEYRDIIITQVKTLIFAGHDSSSSTVCYTYNLLSKHPEALAKVRKEHDDVFGTDLDDAARQLTDDPTLLNKLPYTMAVLKESLRLWPPIGGSYRKGHKDTPLKAEGQLWPTYDFAVFVNDHAIMRRDDVFRDPERFYPERHLVADPNDPYFVRRNAWRAFEKGPRNCIGEPMALIQLKVIMVLTLRRYDFLESYPADTPTVNGEKMYQTLHVTAKPSLGMPCRVKRAGDSWKSL